MEQQTQQPSQQEQSSTPSGKNFLANRKLPLIAAIIAITLSVGGILLLQAGLGPWARTVLAHAANPAARAPTTSSRRVANLPQ